MTINITSREILSELKQTRKELAKTVKQSAKELQAFSQFWKDYINEITAMSITLEAHSGKKTNKRKR